MSDRAKVRGAVRLDNPIRSEKEDVLNRTKAASSFADQILSLDASHGVVAGVLGPWGSGKTSFLNLTVKNLSDRGVVVVDFNPWMFSGADQLVESFFVELSAQIKLRKELADIAKLVDDYGEVFAGFGWIPAVGPWIERGRLASKGLAKVLERKKKGVVGRRQKLERALKAIDGPLVVTLDDIDRLDTSEIRDIFKLVRLTASFPNVVYVLAFDRARVEGALAEQHIPGRDYLEKILQVGIDLPSIPSEILSEQTIKAIEKTLQDVKDVGKVDMDLWPDIYTEIIQPLIRNMRDVSRYAAAIHATVRDLGPRVATVDLLAMEAIRIFLPDVFSHIHGAVAGLTTASDEWYGGRRESPELKAQVDLLINAAGERQSVAKALVLRLFPAAGRYAGGSNYGAEWKGEWLRERRVAIEEILRFYLERRVGEGLRTFSDAEQAWARATDQIALEKFLRSLDPERIRYVIASLEAYEDQFSAAQVVPTSVVLLKLMPELPNNRRGIFDIGPKFALTRVLFRLLRALKSPELVENAVSEILSEIKTLSSKMELLTIVGHPQGAGHGLVSAESAKKFERAWRAEVRSTELGALIGENDLLTVLCRAKLEVESDEEHLELSRLPQFVLALLRSAHRESLVQSAGSRSVRREAYLDWDGLIALYGSEELLRGAVASLRNSEIDADPGLLILVDKYLSGWRPHLVGGRATAKEQGTGSVDGGTAQ